MRLISIAAVSQDGVIGIGEDIPWKIPEDFKHFRNTTMGNLLIVGATTFKTLPPKAHEGREFIILNSGKRLKTSGKCYQFSDADMVFSLLDADMVNEKAYIIGGSSIYYLFIDYCEEALITWVDMRFEDKTQAFMFPVEKLENDFGIINDGNWLTSKTGLKYKITHYRRNYGS